MKVRGLCERGFLFITLGKGSSLFTAIVSHCNSFLQTAMIIEVTVNNRKKVIAMHTFLLFILCQGLFYASVISINVILHKVATLIISILQMRKPRHRDTKGPEPHGKKNWDTGQAPGWYPGGSLPTWALAIALRLLVVEPVPLGFPVQMWHPLSAFYWRSRNQACLGAGFKLWGRISNIYTFHFLSSGNLVLLFFFSKSI